MVSQPSCIRICPSSNHDGSNYRKKCELFQDRKTAFNRYSFSETNQDEICLTQRWL